MKIELFKNNSLMKCLKNYLCLLKGWNNGGGSTKTADYQPIFMGITPLYLLSSFFFSFFPPCDLKFCYLFFTGNFLNSKVLCCLCSSPHPSQRRETWKTSGNLWSQKIFSQKKNKRDTIPTAPKMSRSK